MEVEKCSVRWNCDSRVWDMVEGVAIWIVEGVGYGGRSDGRCCCCCCCCYGGREMTVNECDI